MAKRKAKTKAKQNPKEEKTQYTMPSPKWYRNTRFFFFLFLGLIIFRVILFFLSEGEMQKNDIWLRMLMVSFGTFLGWWYVTRRGKRK